MDNIGSETLFMKVLYVDYDVWFCQCRTHGRMEWLLIMIAYLIAWRSWIDDRRGDSLIHSDCEKPCLELSCSWILMKTGYRTNCAKIIRKWLDCDDQICVINVCTEIVILASIEFGLWEGQLNEISWRIPVHPNRIWKKSMIWWLKRLVVISNLNQGLSDYSS